MERMKGMTADEAMQAVLSDPCVHFFTKDTIRRGLTLDCVDAYNDVNLAAHVLRKVMDKALGRGR